jgi:hypothetical protein
MSRSLRKASGGAIQEPVPMFGSQELHNLFLKVGQSFCIWQLSIILLFASSWVHLENSLCLTALSPIILLTSFKQMLTYFPFNPSLLMHPSLLRTCLYFLTQQILV